MTSKQQGQSSSAFIEHVTTPLNACSVETLPDPIEMENGEKIWPLMLGCYELNESTGEREGRLDLYSIKVPTSNTPLEGFGTQANVFGPDNRKSGVLDGKWLPKKLKDDSYLYATAHAAGDIVVHKVLPQSESELSSFQISQSGTTEKQEGICLALAWDVHVSTPDHSRIISSYSNGKVAIHQAGISGSAVDLQETACWDAHKMFQSPAEVWCANFTSNPNVVMTGGDEGKLKIWDLRELNLPMHTLQTFDAGVTVISPHPRIDHLVACGSYDETLAIFDLRNVSNQKPKPLCHSESVGGGLWRVKWHPFDDNKLLLGAMHGGCRVVKLNDDFTELQIQQEFTNHESMAYGADWLSCKDANGGVEAAASCSFYDRALYLWEVRK